MTTLFDERERAAEWAFAHEQEVRFLMHCDALKALAGYASARLGHDAAEAEAYAKDVVAALVQGTKDDALIERVRADLDAHGIAETASGLRERLSQFLAKAVLDRRSS